MTIKNISIVIQVSLMLMAITSCVNTPENTISSTQENTISIRESTTSTLKPSIGEYDQLLLKQSRNNTWVKVPSKTDDINDPLYRSDVFLKNEKSLTKIDLASKLLFSYDEDSVKSNASLTIKKMIQINKKPFSENFIYVVGHTDSDGSAPYNLGLSSRRAMNVVKILHKYGIPAGKLYVIPAGEHMPKVSNTTRKNKSINRRVEIYHSQSRVIALEYLREKECPLKTCEFARVSILKVNRDFKMTSARVDNQIPESLVLMEKDFQRRVKNNSQKSRDLPIMKITIRESQIKTKYRKIKLLASGYHVKLNDKVRLNLSSKI
jgi:outer membrane protein OmpA-like peptidoglycan-associated protein